MKYACLILLVISNVGLYAQTVSGIVLENSQPLSLVNISLIRAHDSLLEKAAMTDNKGYYKLENIRPGFYILNASRIGYKPQFLSAITIKVDAGHIELPVLTLVPVAGQLAEVTVTGRRPFIEQKIDRTVINVANSIVNSGSTALEVLEKAPGIVVDRQNDQIIFRGKEGVIVQIDGKQTYLSMPDLVALLRNMPADNIDRVELITNPSAKYDAAGNSGIIDIRLKKNNNIGTNGSVSVGIGSGRHGRQRGNVQINHRAKRINVFGNYSGSSEGNYWDFDFNTRQPDGSQLNFIQQFSPIRFKNRGQNARAGIDYFINAKTIAGVVWTGTWSSSREKSPAEASFRREEGGDIYFQTLTDKSLSNKQSNHLFNFNIMHAFTGKGQFSADLDLGRFNRDFKNFLITDTIIPVSVTAQDMHLLSQMPTQIDIFSFRMDYASPIGKNGKIEAGIKGSRIKSDNNLELSTGHEDNLVIDPGLSNHFRYMENVYAAYISFSGKLNQHTDVLAGLRAEHTHSVGNAITSNNKVTRDYFNLFPSIFITRSFHKNHILNLSYSYRIDRPNYQSLNPARSYIDPYMYSAGNSFLTPQFTHSLELKHGFRNKLFTSLGASFISDLVFFVTQPVDAKTTQRMPENIGKSQAYNLTIAFPVTVMKGWAMQTNLVGIYSRFQYRYRDIDLRATQASGRLNQANMFTLGKGWTAELSGRISTPAVNVLFRSPWLGTMDAGVQKSFLKNWKARLSLQDVFHTNRVLGKIRVPEYERNVRITMDTRILLLNITYTFGNQQLKNSRQRKTAADEEVQRTN